MKSWLDLTDKEKRNYIDEFNKKNKGLTTIDLHWINVSLIIIIIILLFFGRTIANSESVFITIVAIRRLLIIIYILNIIRIYKINKKFKTWLETRNIRK